MPQVAVLDLWRRPGVTAAERADQALAGTPLRPLRAEAEWIQVQAPDGYLGWAAAASLAFLDAAAVRRWAQGPWVRLTAAAPLRREPDGPPLLQALAGTCLPLAERRGGWLALRWPAGGEVLLSAAAGQVLRSLPHPLRPGRSVGSGDDPLPAAAAIVATAWALLGAPYRPGGATPAGFDAGGYLRYVFACHGVALPRDPDQQWAATHPLGPADDSLPADLVFFGRRAGLPEAAGLYLGDGGCILCGPGGVQAVSFHPGDAAFDPALAAAALGYRRVLPPQGLWGEGI